VKATLSGSELQIPSHGFTWRLGTAARTALGQANLVARGAPPTPAAFVSALFALARHADGGSFVTGCSALDATICADVGEGRGCMARACSDGLGTLARRLDAGFGQLDGDDLDLLLAGSALLADTDNDRKAEAIGRPARSGEGVGQWSAELRTRAGVTSSSSSWTAERILP